MINLPKALTTGQIARHCGVSLRTVIRWIERGHLKAFQLPGRGDNRVQVHDLLEFLKENGMPIPSELQSYTGRILIVEDDTPMAQAMQRALRRAGFETAVAPDGFRAGTLLGAFQPSVVTLDLGLPGLGGINVLKFIRDTPPLAGVKILVVSAMPQKDLEAALVAGADDVLEKPFRNEALVEKVRNLSGWENTTTPGSKPVGRGT